MIVAGRVSQKMAPVLRQIYDQMMEPKWVISHGRVRQQRRHVQQLRHRAGRRPDRARSTSTPRAARPGPRRSSTPSSPCTRRSATASSPRRRRAPAAAPASHVEQRDGQPDRSPSPLGRARRDRWPTTPPPTTTPRRRPSRRRPSPSCVHGVPGHRAAAASACCTPAASELRRPRAHAARRRRLPRCASTSPPSTTSPTTPTAALPDGVEPERFEVVVDLLSHAAARAAAAPGPGARRRPDGARRCSTCTPAPRPWSARCSTCSASPSTATPTSPASSCPRTGTGHPLRKDYAVGAHPGAVQGRRRTPAMTRRSTDAQLGHRRPPRAPRRWRRRERRPAPTSCSASSGAVLRLSEAEAADLRRARRRAEDETMIINMGPQHPSAPTACCGSCSSSRARRCCAPSRSSATCTPAWRRRARTLTYLQGATNVTRMDYAVAALQRAGVLAGHRAAARHRGARPRATWIRMLLCELNRIVVAPAVPRHQRHGPRRGVDDDLRLARARGGAAVPRDDHRPADEPQLHPPRRRRRRPARRLARRRAAAPRHASRRASTSTTSLLTGQPIWRERLQGVGVITAEEAIALGATGPILRSTGVRLGPAPRHAVPALRPGRLRRRRRHLRRLLRPLRHPAQRDPRVDADRPPDPRRACRRATTGSRTRRSRRRRGPASTSRWRR